MEEKQQTVQEIYRLEQLSKTFTGADQQIHALREVSLSICEGEIFGIIGLSGAGKSTLIRCLNLLERPSAGRVIFRGTDLTALTEKELLETLRRIGMIFQNYRLMQQRTVLENIRFPLELAGVKKREGDRRARRMLELVGLAEKEKAYPCELSGGQQQRVAIARALAAEPDVLLCDEITSALDPMTTASVLDLLQKINRELGVTVVLITHEMAVVQAVCQRVAVIDRGSVAEIGEVEEVFRNPQSAIARELIYPKGKLLSEGGGDYDLRLVFDGVSANAPVLANAILASDTPVSILSADSRSIEGKVYGQMIIRTPEDSELRDRIIRQLRDNGITVTLVSETTQAAEQAAESR